jgi:hypothetical protein
MLRIVCRKYISVREACDGAGQNSMAAVCLHGDDAQALHEGCMLAYADALSLKQLDVSTTVSALNRIHQACRSASDAVRPPACRVLCPLVDY